MGNGSTFHVCPGRISLDYDLEVFGGDLPGMPKEVDEKRMRRRHRGAQCFRQIWLFALECLSLRFLPERMESPSHRNR